MKEEGEFPLAPPGETTPTGAGDGGDADGYWARRLGNRPRSADAWPPRPPSPADAPPGLAAPPAGEAGAGISRPPRAPQPTPAVAPQRWWSRPVVRYGPYRAHDPVKNFVIGGVAVVMLIAVTVVSAVVTASSVRSTLGSLTALPSSGSNTVAWYWGVDLTATSNAAQPLNVENERHFTTVVASRQRSSAYFVALDQRGTAYAWGSPAGPTAPLEVTTQPAAVNMPPGVRFTSVATNDGYALALDQNGHIWNWGNVNRDELAPAAAVSLEPSSPVALPTPPGVTFRAVSAGWNFSVALDSTGRAWAWGANNGEGTLALTTNAAFVPAPTPITMPPGVSFTAVSAGWVHAVALDSAGRAWAWGDDSEGQLGVDTATLPTGASGPCGFGRCSATPVPVKLPAGVRLTAVAAGEDYTAAVDTSGRVWTWGTNDHGALGLVDTATTCASAVDCNSNGQPSQPTDSTPAAARTPAGLRFVAVAVTQGQNASEDATIALDSHGAAWAWGANLILHFPGGTGPCFSPSNQAGTMATGTELCMLRPTQLDMPSGVTFKRVTASGDALFGLPR